MKWLPVLTTLWMAVSCGPGQPTYQDRVHPLSEEDAHPLFRQLLPLIVKPGELPPDQLIRTWKEFLADAPLPLRQETNFTFVYYDFSHSLKRVFLEASFAPNRLEPLVRVGTSALFFRVYSIAKPALARYRFSDGTHPLADPFHADLEPGDELWHPLVIPVTTEPTVQWISGVSEDVLNGQDLRILLPPSYRRNLALTYPLVVVAGMEKHGWTQPLEQMMSEETVHPFIVVSVGASAGLKALLEEKVVPWMKRHYRVSPQASDLVLVGWGSSAKAVQDLAAARPDYWNRIWTPSVDQAKAAEVWNTLAPPFFRTLFAVVAP